MKSWHITTIMMVLCLTILLLGIAAVAADEDYNVGILQTSVKYHNFVAPSTQTSFLIHVTYAIHDKANIKCILFNGTLSNLGPELWHSSVISVIGPTEGALAWAVNLTAPASEGNWRLTAIAYYQSIEGYLPPEIGPNNSTAWYFYNDTTMAYEGPSYLQFTLKVSKPAQLVVDLGVSGVTINAGDNSTTETASDGTVTLPFHVGEIISLSVPSVFPLQNSTRLIFQGWSDGIPSGNRTIMLDGDMKLVGAYGRQYLLRVDSVVPAYDQSTWHNPSSSVSLQVNSSVPMSWPLGMLGFRYTFKGWSGSVQSHATQLNVTIDQPMIVSADYGVDYSRLVIPSILAIGIGGAIVSVLLHARRPIKPSPVEEELTDEQAETSMEEGVITAASSGSRLCDKCDQPVQEDWTHCPRCGNILGSG